MGKGIPLLIDPVRNRTASARGVLSASWSPDHLLVAVSRELPRPRRPQGVHHGGV